MTKDADGITHIFFDAWGTLFTDPTWSLSAFCERLARSLRDPEFKARFEEATHMDEAEATDQVRHLLRLADISQSEFEIQELAALLEGATANGVLYDEAAAALPRLAKHYTLGLISNSSRRAARHIRGVLQNAIGDLFGDRLFFSSEIGLQKPDPALFEYVARQCHLHPAQCLYVGDNPHDDYYPPEKAGWQARMLIKRDKDRQEAQANGLLTVTFDELAKDHMPPCADMPSDAEIRARVGKLLKHYSSGK